MKSIREEIEGLWAELMFCDEEKDQFFGFIDGERHGGNCAWYRA